MKLVSLALASVVASVQLVALDACTVHGQATVTGTTTPIVYQQPPAAQVEAPIARKGYVWAGGRWDWQEGHWVWIDGHWERARANQTWITGTWQQRGTAWHWQEGRWATVTTDPTVETVNPGSPDVRDHREGEPEDHREGAPVVRDHRD